MPQIVVASYLEAEHLSRIRAVDERLSVFFDPAMVPAPRYAADHVGDGRFRRSRDKEVEWLARLEDAEILFDFDRTHEHDLPDLAPDLRWIQGTSAGIGQYVISNNYHIRMPKTVFTTASGVHAKPLAEYCLMSMLIFSRGLFRVLRDQRRRHWERYAGTDLAGRTVVIVGLGAIGKEIARAARAFGMHVIGVKRRVTPTLAEAMPVDELYPPAALNDALHRAEFLILVAPHTAETKGMIGRDQLHLMPVGSVIINVGRGPLIDEQALIEALKSGHLGGASLDVFRTEPLPGDSPLWDLPNVLISPHSGSTSDRENARITDIFCDNIQRYLAGKSLRNVFDTEHLY